MIRSVNAMRTVFPHRAAGFTIIEILIVVAIIAILGAVALPSYSAYVVKANRNAAQAVIVEVASRQERQLIDNRGYAANITALTSAGLVIPATVAANYTVTTTSPRTGMTTPSYEVKAVPTGNQLAKDTKCGTLTLDETGLKGETGTGTVASCWEQ